LLKNLFNLNMILLQNEHILKKRGIFMVNLVLDEFTFRRINALLSDLMDKRKRNMDYNDLVNELIDNYQQNNWDHDVLSGG
jgi:predicted transcriptional regulator YheO